MAERKLLCYYGDDFTGSTDVLEALFGFGIRATLFLEPPNDELLRGKFADREAFGVAGVGRSLTPEEAERELRPIFATLKQTGAAIVHYKICSTFDSSPEIGSIGKAAELGREIFGGAFIPLVAGVPYLGRYTLFGQHFAAAGGDVYRLDRHPTMSRHPVTPMAEADLRRHLAKQTELSIALMNINELDGDPETVATRLLRKLKPPEPGAAIPEMVLFDVLDERRLETVGRLIAEEAAAGEGSLFVIGSSGVEYALGAAWRAQDRQGGSSGPSVAGGANGSAKPADKANAQVTIAARSIDPVAASSGDPSGQPPMADGAEAKTETVALASSAVIAPVDKLLVVSGSCSPVTEGQIAAALAAGFAGLRIPAAELFALAAADAEDARGRLLLEAKALLDAGRSVVLYSAAGPADGSIGLVRRALEAAGYRPEDSSRLLGKLMGSLARELAAAAGLTRMIIAGGDTSGYVTRELGIYALECVSALTPGAPLCRAYADSPEIDGLELVLKGGQIGEPDFFERVRRGGVPRAGDRS